MELWTIGHGGRSFTEFATMLQKQGIEEVWDVRSAPGSRRHPQFGKAELPPALHALGMAYIHAPALGGWRHAPKESSAVGYWQHPSFRGFAAYMLQDEFRDALERLVSAALGRRVCLLCAETVPWRCHRYLIADALVLLHGATVHHLLSPRSAQDHKPTPAARIRAGRVSYVSSSE